MIQRHRHFQRFVIGALSLFAAFLAKGSDTPESMALNWRETVVLSAISEPENNLVRHFKIFQDGAHDIRRLQVIPDRGNLLSFELDQLQRDEVVVAQFAGLSSVFLRAYTLNPSEVLLKVRYLKLFTGSYDFFDLMLKRDANGAWRLYDPNGGDAVKWVYFRSKTFLGAPIGIESYEFYGDKPSHIP